MHIPDGFLAPQVYIPAYLVDIGLLFYAFKRFKKDLKEKTIPYLASLSAFSFIIMSIAIPLPGGTSVDGLGVASLSLLFGPWTAFLSISLVLFLQATIFGEGGITSFPINSLSIAFLGSLCAHYTYLIAKRYLEDRTSLFLSGFLSTLISAFAAALVLGIHPYLFKDPFGKPLYFPFKLSLVLPAVLFPHILVGIGEGILTIIIVRALRDRI
ncbi:MAG TPA: cobalamin biosynthesis protein CbiM [Aquificaceae bacterium]|nr:cobalamin biosynthesis protein CbiM [Aquificaceae bacterium]